MTTRSNKQAKPAWTVLVYLAGDNNLTEDMVWGLQELKKTAHRLSPKQKGPINVVAHFDPRGSRGRRYDFVPTSTINPPPHPAEDDGNLHLYEAMVYNPVVVAAQHFAEDGAAGAGEASTAQNQLAAFLKEQVRRLPRASEYFLILSGHGSGAVGDFLIDLDPATSLSIPELARILKEGRNAYWNSYREVETDERRPVSIRKRIGVLGMDSCLMSNAEVCYEVREHADFLVASEGFVANAGWPYHRVLEACFEPGLKTVDPAPRSVALRVARNYSLFYQDYEISDLSTDIAVCDLAKFRATQNGSLVGLLQKFSSTCTGSLESVFVHDVLKDAEPKLEKASALPAQLSKEIAGLLFKEDEKQKAALEALLRGGSKKATKALKNANGHGILSGFQRKALRELRAVVYGRDGRHQETLGKEIDSPSSRQNALAVVRAIREFDPGVLEALRVIEEQEAKGKCEAKKARASLQKLHQVRSLLDLSDRAKGAAESVDDDLRLRDAVIAARWQAQTFKGGVYVDLFDFCRCLEDRLPHLKDLLDLCGRVMRSIEGEGGAVLLSRYTGPAFQHAHGLSVYFPGRADDYTPEYENLEFAKATGWGRFVRAYLRATRRPRRDERTHLAQADDHILRFDALEIDPLDTDGIEARIVGVAGTTTRDGLFQEDHARAGTDKNIRAGTDKNIRAGTDKNIRAGTDKNIRGEAIRATWGNPPDGFFRQSSS